MAGEINKTRGIVLAINPWSRTSHVTTWLTPDHGVVTTLVKGAVRPKSAFLGQYDLFYECDLLYYARTSSGNLHALREVTPINLREPLRGRWRETSIAGYIATIVRDLAPPTSESGKWYAFMDGFLELAGNGTLAPLALLVKAEMDLLSIAGLAPDFSGAPPRADWFPFAIDLGRCGESSRMMRLSQNTLTALRRPDAATTGQDALLDASRFLGAFLAYHLEAPPELRRTVTTICRQTL